MLQLGQTFWLTSHIDYFALYSWQEQVVKKFYRLLFPIMLKIVFFIECDEPFFIMYMRKIFCSEKGRLVSWRILHQIQIRATRWMTNIYKSPPTSHSQQATALKWKRRLDYMLPIQIKQISIYYYFGQNKNFSYLFENQNDWYARAFVMYLTHLLCTSTTAKCPVYFSCIFVLNLRLRSFILVLIHFFSKGNRHRQNYYLNGTNLFFIEQN